jgi:hypothetical protein
LVPDVITFAFVITCRNIMKRPSVEEMKPTSSAAPSNKASAKGITYCTYGIGPPSWIKEINT